MVPRKSWVSEHFSPISESQQRSYQVSEARFFLVWFRNRLSPGLGFSNKGLSVSASLGFYHSPSLLLTCLLNTQIGHGCGTDDHFEADEGVKGASKFMECLV